MSPKQIVHILYHRGVLSTSTLQSIKTLTNPDFVLYHAISSQALLHLRAETLTTFCISQAQELWYQETTVQVFSTVLFCNMEVPPSLSEAAKAQLWQMSLDQPSMVAGGSCWYRPDTSKSCVFLCHSSCKQNCRLPSHCESALELAAFLNRSLEVMVPQFVCTDRQVECWTAA